MSPINAALAQGLRRELACRKNPERARGAAAYMKVALPFIGVSMPEVRRLTREVLREHPLQGYATYQSTLRELFFGARFQEERYAALAVAADRRSAGFQRFGMLATYGKMIVAAGWWDLVDDLSCRVGDVLVRDPARSAPILRRWSRHDDLWLRRAAIICQRKSRENTDLDLLYDCIEPSLASPEFFLKKAIGWALRSLAWHDPGAVRRYVRGHADQLSPLSRREALKNLKQ